MPKKKEQVLSFHNTPAFYKAYMENWLVQKKKAGGQPAEIAIIEDIKTLVEVAVDVLNPVPTESGKDKS